MLKITARYESRTVSISQIKLVFVLFLVSSEHSSLSGHFITCQILVIGSDLVDQSTIRKDLHDPVGSGLHKLMVMAGEQSHTGELDQPVVQGGDRLHIQMVGRLVEDQAVCTA